MLTVEDIDRQIAGDRNSFNSKIYDGYIHHNIVEYFKKAIIGIPPSMHQIKADAIRAIMNKRPDELNTWEVGTIINIVLAAKPKEVFDGMTELLEVLDVMEKVRTDYNKITEQYQKSEARKKVKLMEIAGLNKNNTARLIAK